MKSIHEEWITLVAFLMTVFIAGFNALGVRFTVLELPPF